MNHKAGRVRLRNDERVNVRGACRGTSKGDEIGWRWGRTDGEDETAEITRRLSDDRNARLAVVARMRAEEW